MPEHRFETLTRTAAELVSRRSSLLALGSAAVAAVLGSAPVAKAAKKDNGTKRLKKKLRRTTQEAQQVRQEFAAACAAQPGQCQAAMTALCATAMDPQQCLQIVTPCCAQITNCNVGPAFTCLLSL